MFTMTTDEKSELQLRTEAKKKKVEQKKEPQTEVRMSVCLIRT